ncbi:hypothetical protein SAMN04488544_3530 [Microlunatus sagamiharensis]|uniref:Dolichyl-phosphate-mannose-protein mannosyltransferase n=1 Tax=Microlunatus sagamiharensis TaxID=546874 RepID=A0A1H2N8E2_9ACTN|nr:hypothetical protein [Microlunatus sagamiharensis]SDV01757.1 hypothetical protein SAMN04488544_3530 [Microlunatus sagamiharensis]
MGTLVFAAAGALLLHAHEPWRDELQAWLIARSSGSPVQLWDNARYEGHPLLWHLLLFFAGLVSGGPATMQVVHLLVGAVMVHLLLRFAPLRRRHRLGLGLGYLMLYEYTVISRNYSLGVLAAFGFCVLWRTRTRSCLPLAAVLLLMAQTNPMAVLLVPSLALLLAADLLLHHRSTLRLPVVVSGAVVVGLGLLMAWLQLRTPPDWLFPSGTPAPFSTLLTVVWRSFVPVPRLGVVGFWNSNVLSGHDAVMTVLSATLLLAAVVVLRRTPLVALSYVLATATLLAFFKVEYFGNVRHQGYVLLVFLVHLWLSRSTPTGRPAPRATRVLTAVLLDVVVVGQLAGVAVAGYQDVRHPFSNARAAARMIIGAGLGNRPVVADSDAATSAVAAYLDHPVYYVKQERWGTFAVWDQRRTRRPSQPEVLEAASRLGRDSGGEVVLLLSYPLDASTLASAPHLVEVGATDRSTVVASERDYHVYVLRPS